MSREEQGIEINLMQLIKRLLDSVKYIALVTVVFAIMGFIYSSYFATPVYEASARMIVNTRKDQNSNVTNDQLNSAKNLVETYAVIICGRDVLTNVITELDLQMDYEELAKAISVKAVHNTPIMQISVKHCDRDTALAITEKLLEIAPETLVRTTEAGSIKPVDQAYAELEPISPNVLKNTIIVAFLGFALTCAVILFVSLMDHTYMSDEDIQKDLGIPVLGVIPAVESCMDYNRQENAGKGDK